MNPERTLLLVGAKDETVRKARDLGLHVLLAQHPSKLTEYQRDLADRVEVVDYTDWTLLEPIVRDWWSAPGFAVALSLTEAGVENAGRVNDRYDLGGTGFAVAHRFRDKWAMRRHLADRGLPTVAAATLRHRADLDDFAAGAGFPFIVKPTDATAGVGIFRVTGPADVEPVWDRVQRWHGRRTDRGSTLYTIRDYLLEQYVDGPEFSVEAFSFAGRHVVVGITEKFVDPRHFAELGHAVPARLAPPDRRRVAAAVREFLDGMGLRDGVSHTELRLGPSGPVVIESHNRPGGGAIPDLVRAAYGIDLPDHALGWPFGLVPELPDDPPARAAASTRFLVAPPGRIESVTGVTEAQRQPDVLTVQITAQPGGVVRPLADNWDRLGLVAVTAADTTTAVRRGAQLISDTIRIRVVDADGTGHWATAADIPDESEPATTAADADDLPARPANRAGVPA